MSGINGYLEGALRRYGDSEVGQSICRLREYDYDQLERNGLCRDHSDYRYVVTYPFKPLMKPLRGLDALGGYHPEEPLALYVHLPFCLSLCTFCSRFIKTTSVTQKQLTTYVDTLIEEMELLGGTMDCKPEFDSVYFGGGTPSVLPDEEIIRLLEYVLGELEIGENAEVTWETSPETAIPDKISMLLDHGVNRISMGVQDFDDGILRGCNRLHTGKKAEEAMMMMGELGCRNLNIDLIHGLPGQTVEQREKTLAVAASLKPASVTDYPLYIHPGSKLAELSPASFPTPEERLLMQARAIDKFTGEGYRHRPIHWFTAQGISHRQQEGKFQNQELLGIGMSTYSFVNGYQYFNRSELDGYVANINRGRIPVETGLRLTREQTAARHMIFGMKLGFVDKKAFAERYGKDMLDGYDKVVRNLSGLGLLRDTRKRLEVTPLGVLFNEETALRFIDDETRRMMDEKGVSRYGNY